MTVGLRVFNDDNILQITDEYASYVIVQKGQVTLGAPRTQSIASFVTTSGPYAEILVPNTTGYPPLIAINGNVPVSVYQAYLSGSNWVYALTGVLASATGAVVNYYIFAPTPNIDPGGGGLALYRADGTLAYHSGYTPIRIKGILSDSSQSSIYLTSGRTYAAAVLQTKYQVTTQVPSGVYTQYVLQSSIKCRTDGVDISFERVEQAQSSVSLPAPGVTFPNFFYFAVDVTNA